MLLYFKSALLGDLAQNFYFFMKKMYYSSVLMAILLALCVGFSSCSDDDDDDGGGYKGEGYLEVVVNGKTYKENYIDIAPGGRTNITDRYVGGVETPDADIDFTLYHYTNEKDFKNVKTGSFGIDDPYGNKNNFSLLVGVHSDGGWYEYVAGGKNNITNIKHLSTDSQSGVLTYLIEGTFSCSFKHSTDGKTLEMSGKYWTKLKINPESKS